MSMLNVGESIREFVEKRFMIGRELMSIKTSDSLIEKGIIDSTGVMELVGYLEETFGISIDDDDISPENLGSFENIVSYVMKKKA